MKSVRLRVATAAVVTLGMAGCGLLTDGGAGSSPDSSEQASTKAGGSTSPESDPDAPTAWGPTEGELARAREMVKQWDASRLAGQVIVGRFHGTDPEAAAQMVRDLHLAGLSVTSGNIADTAQVMAMTEAIEGAVAADGRDFPAIIGVDQEGGYVSHLRGIATEFPSFSAAGRAIALDGATGRRVTREAAYATGLEVRHLGFTWVFAPVADVTIGAADPTIGERSASEDPKIAAKAAASAVRGYEAAGVVSTVKHFPGHGAATTDSHDTLPVLDSTLEEIQAHDLPPFEAAIATGAPAVMMSHLDLSNIAPGVPASLAPQVYDLLRDVLGFEGVTITDSLGMGAVTGRPKPAVQALIAGADLLLMPVDTAVTHGIVTDAIRSGEVSRERAEEAAARVVALQMWQRRVAAQVSVPDDVTQRAQDASVALTEASW